MFSIVYFLPTEFNNVIRLNYVESFKRFFIFFNISTQTWCTFFYWTQTEVLFSTKWKWMVTTAVQKRFQLFSMNNLTEFLTRCFGHMLLGCFHGAFSVLFAPGPHSLSLYGGSSDILLKFSFCVPQKKSKLYRFEVKILFLGELSL